ncbi:MAG: hypothetical protein GAK30_02541 [Paracidovorax wautersii]|uniref:HTH tetR-type domain-containing protein n=1 Tax=Paracidovorax wautersii TaxID=1177982 RepID=A0A7V8JPN7_9BURK|nr:MAG: hypothetical protein GAK30_02541 [Paracidovorax wautersii]
MKSKSETRRQAMLDAAAVAFQAGGFERTSMEDIAARAQCSKVTLYGYFESKEQLFYESIVAAVDREFIALAGLLQDPVAPVEAVLLGFGERFISLIASPRVRSLRGLVTAAATHGATDLGLRCYKAGPEPVKKVCTRYLAQVHAQGQLRIPDPELAGLQLRALLEAEWLDALFYGAPARPTRRRIHESTQRAVQAFLAIYQPVEQRTDAR